MEGHLPPLSYLGGLVRESDSDVLPEEDSLEGPIRLYGRGGRVGCGVGGGFAEVPVGCASACIPCLREPRGGNSSDAACRLLRCYRI